MRTFLNLTDWSTKAQAGTKPKAAVRLPMAAGDATEMPEPRVLRFTLSTSNVDRQNDTIDVNGWQTDEFMRTGGPVLWSHDYHQPPIARAIAIKVENGKLVADAEFVPAEISPFAETIYQMVKQGFLKGCSVGFKPIKWAINEERRGCDFISQSLLEFSVTPVPASPDAIYEAKSAGIDTAPLVAWAESVLKSAASPDALAVLKSATQGALPLATEPDDEDIPDPVKAVDDPVVTKAGRVLSAKNEAAIMAACDAMESASKALRDVLMAAMGKPADDEMDDEEMPKAATASIEKAIDADGADVLRLTIADEPVYDFRLLDDPEPTFTLNPEDLAAVLGASVKAAVVTAVNARVALTLNALRGRLD